MGTRQRLKSQIPLCQLGMSEVGAKMVEFLVTDLSDYVIGQRVPVCREFAEF
ncbi:MAG: hypothetical protein VCF25_14540 [Candidatus Poribacteria bacterium]